MSAIACLSDDELNVFSTGSLPPGQVERMADHLLHCAGCQQRLAEMDNRANPVLDALRQPSPPAETPRTLTLQWKQVPPAEPKPAAGPTPSPEPATPAPRVVNVSLTPPAAEPQIPTGASSAPKLSSEIRTLLQFRLRIASVIATAAGLFILGEYLSDQQGNMVIAKTGFSWLPLVLLVAAISAFLIGSVLLWMPRAWPIQFLRRIEVITFGLGVVFLAVTRFQYFTAIKPELFSGPEHMRTHLELAVLLSNLFWYILFLCYGLFVPNTWRRCAAVLGCMSAVFFLVTIIPGLANPAITHRLPFMVGVTLIGIFMVGGLALFGSFKISELQAEAFAARQLGQYQLKRKLGAGGMGEVYLAEHRLLKRPCAIKLISPARASDPSILQRFEREVQATAQLTHPNTVEVFDYGRTEDGTFYYVMEYLPGITLADLVEQNGALPPARAVHFVRQLCGALNEAHQAGLVHRDIKPGNVIVCKHGGRDDVVKLLDFGLVLPARQNTGAIRLTEENIIMGTPDFMAPEQATGQAVDARSDIYSLGALMYFLLTGEPPFSNRSTLEVLFAHIHEPAPRPRKQVPSLPLDLERVVLCCLEKKPEERFPDTAMLEAALARCECAGDWGDDSGQEWWRARTSELVAGQGRDLKPI